MGEKPILGVLLGNSAGVGPELVAMLAVKDYCADYCRPVIIGDLHQLDTAIGLCKAGKIESFVFGPFHKDAMKMAGMHDESERTYLADAFQLTTPFCEVNMMDDLMTVRTTSHIPISEVSATLTETTLREAVELGEITGESLGHKPRIAVAALNPHCGEFGLCGRKEVDIIQPTIEKVVKGTGWNVTGPYSADTLFISALKLVGFRRCITVAGGQPCPIAGCAETTYIELLSQMVDDRMYAGNAAGCSSAVSGGTPILPYCKDSCGPGPAIVISYCPCLEQHIKADMGCSQDEMKKAVGCGYWHCYRYGPRLAEQGKNPFRLDSPEPDTDKRMEFLMGENCFASLKNNFPEKADAR